MSSKGFATADANYLKFINYRPVQEAVYTIEHPLVIEWTETFHREFRARQIFERYQAAVANSPKLERAVVVGSCWYRFSNFVPWLLCHAAAKVSTNRLRHYVIQTAFEELGMRNVDEIHAEMFRQTVGDTQGVLASRYAHGDERPLASLEFLRESAQRLDSDGFVLGFLLGMEIPAEENIQTIFDEMSFDAGARTFLENTAFFRLHRQIESEHIRLNVSTFLRFCAAESDRADFRKGVSLALDFWERFWVETSEGVRACGPIASSP